MRILRGNVDFDDPASMAKRVRRSSLPCKVTFRDAAQEGLLEYAWLTREEVQERVEGDLWRAVEGVLSPY